MDSPMKSRHEKMRIAGKLVDGDTGKNIEVFNPYDGSVVGTVPRASRAQIAGAFEIAANYKPKLTRYERQKILMRIAELIVERKEEISDLITAECGLSKKDSIYEVGRAFDVYSLAGQLCINDDSQVFSGYLGKALVHYGLIPTEKGYGFRVSGFDLRASETDT